MQGAKFLGKKELTRQGVRSYSVTTRMLDIGRDRVSRSIGFESLSTNKNGGHVITQLRQDWGKLTLRSGSVLIHVRSKIQHFRKEARTKRFVAQF